MIHLQRFIDRVQGNESRGLRDFTMSMSDARAMHAELTRLLLELQNMRDQIASVQQKSQEVIQVEMGGGTFK